MKRSDCISSGWAMLLTVIHLPKRLSCVRMARRWAGGVLVGRLPPSWPRRVCILPRTLPHSMMRPMARLTRMAATSGTSELL